MPAVPHCLFDDFLPGKLHRDLRSHCMALDDFGRGEVLVDGALSYHPELRQGFISGNQLGGLLGPFRARLDAVFPEMAARLGIKPFPYANIELKLAAHGDGDFFKPHRDTFIGKDRPETGGDRLITTVYYMHAQPRGFDGGDLRIHPLGPGETVAVEPRDNRLVAFPSFAIHEVSQLQVPSRAFADSRFSITSWFRRQA